MNKDIKALWIAALRSGEYEQGEGALRQEFVDIGESLYCCLGVLCDLYAKSVENSPAWTSGDASEHIRRYGGRESYPPYFVMEWAGLDSEEGAYTRNDGGWSSLAELNDRGRTFEEIASIIERKF
jgi:hypothetical protein